MKDLRFGILDADITWALNSKYVGLKNKGKVVGRRTFTFSI